MRRLERAPRTTTCQCGWSVRTERAPLKSCQRESLIPEGSRRQMVQRWRIDALHSIPTASSGRPRGRKWANPSKESSRLNMQEDPEPSLTPLRLPPPPPLSQLQPLHVGPSTLWMVLEGVRRRKGEVGRHLVLRFWLREALWRL